MLNCSLPKNISWFPRTVKSRSEVLSPGAILLPRGHVSVSGDNFICHISRGVLLVSAG